MDVVESFRKHILLLMTNNNSKYMLLFPLQYNSPFIMEICIKTLC